MRFKLHLTVVIGGLAIATLSRPASGHPAPRADHAAHGNKIIHVLPRPKPRDLRERQVYRVPSYVTRVVAASKPVLGWPALVAEARKYLGTNPTDRKRLWCATFMNFILNKLGYAGTHSDAARSFAYYGRRIPEPEVGAIAVLTRGKRGGHVGVVTGVDRHGNPIIISGNHNRRVGEGIYPRARVIAYVMPTRRQALARGRTYSPAVSMAPDRPLDSPITELLAAIEAEHAHAEAAAPRRHVSRDRPRGPMRVVQQMPD